MNRKVVFVAASAVASTLLFLLLSLPSNGNSPDVVSLVGVSDSARGDFQPTGDPPTDDVNDSVVVVSPPASLAQSLRQSSPCRDSLQVVNRSLAPHKYCRIGEPECMNWTLFPSDPSSPCEFLCQQRSEARPAVWINSQLRSSAVVPSQDCASVRRAPDPRKCLMSKPVSILLVGHSHTRFLGSMLCMMLNASNCKQFDDQFRNLTILRDSDVIISNQSSNHIRLAFLQANYHYGNKLREVLAKNLSSAEIQGFTHVVFSRGSWDLLFYDRIPSEISADFSSSLTVLFSLLSPKVVRIAHLPHYCHPKIPPIKKKNKDGSLPHNVVRALWRKTCFAEHRLQRMRAINLCALQNLTTRHETISKTVYLYDTYEATKSKLGQVFADELGHHFQDIMLERLAMQFLSDMICPMAATIEASLALPSIAEHDYCREVALHDKKFTQSVECSCHHPTERKDFVCKKFGRSVPDASRRT